MNLFASRSLLPTALRPRCLLVNMCRKVETQAKDDEDAIALVAESEETKALKELEWEKKRNKSRLYPDHYAAYHGINPYPEPCYAYHYSLRYKRRLYGKYGEASGVDPSALWPTKEELQNTKEYESVAYPFTIPEMVEKVKSEKAEELRIKTERENLILAKASKIEQWKREFHEKVKKKATEAAAAKAKRDRVVEEIRRHFGFKIDPKDDRFKEMLEKKEKEEKKLKKQERQKVRDQQLLEQAKEAASASEDPKKNKKESDSDSDSDDEKDIKKK